MLFKKFILFYFFFRVEEEDEDGSVLHLLGSWAGPCRAPMQALFSSRIFSSGACVPVRARVCARVCACACVCVLMCVGVCVRVRVPGGGSRPLLPSLQHPLPARPPHGSGPAAGHCPPPRGRGPRQAAAGRGGSGGASGVWLRCGSGGARAGTRIGFLSVIAAVSWGEAGSEGTCDSPEKAGGLPWHR